MSETIARQIADLWREDAVGRLGAHTSALDDREAALGIALPTAARSLLLEADGMEPFEHDRAMLRFWPVAEWAPARDHLKGGLDGNGDDLVIFADYLILSHFLAVRLRGSDPDGRVAVVGGGSPTWIASDFRTFLEQYVREPLEVVHGGQTYGTR